MELISLVVFIFCAGIAAGTILLTSRLMKENPVPYARPLFYHIIFMFAFGFYGIWGQFIIVTVAGSRLTPDMLSTVSVISLLLGLPFLILGLDDAPAVRGRVCRPASQRIFIRPLHRCQSCNNHSHRVYIRRNCLQRSIAPVQVLLQWCSSVLCTCNRFFTDEGEPLPPRVWQTAGFLQL